MVRKVRPSEELEREKGNERKFRGKDGAIESVSDFADTSILNRRSRTRPKKKTSSHRIDVPNSRAIVHR